MSDSNNRTYVGVTDGAGAALLAKKLTGSVVMLNMLRFREIADYSSAPDLAPEKPISGADAYRIYSLRTLPLLQAAGGEVLYAGTGESFLIGPTDELWDLVLLVRHKSVEKFMAFATDKAYLAGAGHRTAALTDSRLLPLQDAP